MYEWLEAASRRLSEGVNDDPELYRFDEGEIDLILDLAGVAAHEGGHKTNAPLLSYLVGLAHGRHPGASLAELTAVAAGGKVPAKT
jgi:hypothetical protein